MTTHFRTYVFANITLQCNNDVNNERAGVLILGVFDSNVSSGVQTKVVIRGFELVQDCASCLNKDQGYQI